MKLPPNMYGVPDPKAPGGAVPVAAGKLTGDQKLELYQDAVAEYKANGGRGVRRVPGSPPSGSTQDITPPGGRPARKYPQPLR